MMKNKFPPKIRNLVVASGLGLRVPLFFTIDDPKSYDPIKKLSYIKGGFRKKYISKVIIRSAASIEDDEKNSLAGYFESSESINLEDLTPDDVNYYWNLNKKKLVSRNKNAKLCLFIQEFIEFDYSGVFFTESPYNKNEAVLNFSSSDFGVTSGDTVDISGVYSADTKKWKFSLGGEKISKNIINKIASLKTIFGHKFPDGADIELGVKDFELFVVQVRPITRSADEKILLSERERLESIFGSDFKNQIWENNNFTDALGDLTPLSLSMYNCFLNSNEVGTLLLEGGFLLNDVKKVNQTKRFLECIGGRTYYNIYLSQKMFNKPSGFLSTFVNIFKISTKEMILLEKSKLKKKEAVTLEGAFSWLYVSGMYFQFFLLQDKQKYKKDFFTRLKNTEATMDATEPILESRDGIDNFRDDYFYLAENPYELSSRRVHELGVDAICELYLYENKIKNNINRTSFCLGKKTGYWLKEKVYWKSVFLKLLDLERQDLLRRYGDTVFMADNWQELTDGSRPHYINYKIDDKISDNYSQIVGSNYPFPEQSTDTRELIIVPGDIDVADINFINTDDDPTKFFGKTIAVYQFPNYWISKIPNFKAIILHNGNELSHMAITCREYGIPLKIAPSVFK